MANEFFDYAQAWEQGFAPDAPTSLQSGEVAGWPTRPEGPSPPYEESFFSFSDILRDIAGAGESPAGSPAPQTTDWSQLITRTASTVADVANTVGDLTDRILGRSTTAPRVVAPTASGASILPVVLIGGVLAFAFFGGRR